MASEREEIARKLRGALSKRGIAESLINGVLVEVLGEESPQPKPRKRRCGASLPHTKGDQGWHWCRLEMGHATAHNSQDDTSVWWHDGDMVEVTYVDEIFSIPDHVHEYTGDEDMCQGHPGCTLMYGQHRFQSSQWGSGS